MSPLARRWGHPANRARSTARLGPSPSSSDGAGSGSRRAGRRRRPWVMWSSGSAGTGPSTNRGAAQGRWAGRARHRHTPGTMRGGGVRRRRPGSRKALCRNSFSSMTSICVVRVSGADHHRHELTFARGSSAFPECTAHISRPCRGTTRSERVPATGWTAFPHRSGGGVVQPCGDDVTAHTEQPRGAGAGDGAGLAQGGFDLVAGDVGASAGPRERPVTPRWRRTVVGLTSQRSAMPRMVSPAA